MDKRALLFVSLSTLVVVGYFIIEQAFRPEAPPNKNQVAEGADPGDSGPDSTDDGSAQEPTDSGNNPSVGGEPGSEADGSDGENLADSDANESDDDSNEALPDDSPLLDQSESFGRQLVGLGSLKVGSKSRMHATLDNRGGTIRRVELAERNKRDNLTYQETETPAGYLGSLELDPISEGSGARIRMVGAGTPALEATSQTAGKGLRVGDILLSITSDGETSQIASDWELDQFLYNYRPNDSVELLIERDGNDHIFVVELASRPLQLIAPEPADIAEELQHQQSMMLRVGLMDRGFWEPIAPQMTEENWDTYILDSSLVGETAVYKDGPQQGRPADLNLAAGTLVQRLNAAPDPNDDEPSSSATPESSSQESVAGYVQIRTMDGELGYVAADSLQPAKNPEVVFSYVVSSEALAAFGREGPLQILKRYRLPTVTGSKDGSTPEQDYHLEFEIELRNHGSKPEAFAFQLDGPAGVTSEGWWFANKIHGRSTAIGYSAGARDIVGGSTRRSFSFIGGPEIFSNELKRGQGKTEEAVDVFTRQGDQEFRQVNFLGVDAQYFNVSWLPQTEAEDPFVCFSAVGISLHPVTRKQKKERKRVNVTFRVTSEALEIQPYDAANADSAYLLKSQLFAGPKEPKILKQYGLGDVISYGWFAFFSKILLWILHKFHYVLGSYGICIVLLTICVRAAMVPISRKAVRNAQMMQHLQPEIKKIAEKYKNDMEKRQRAQSELFKKYNYNPLGGCLLIFFQLPVFIGLYRGLSVDIALRDQPLIPGLEWCSNLAAPDKLLRWDSIPMPFLFSETGWLGPYLNVLPIITVVLFLVQQKMFTPPATDEQTRMTQRMMTYMMLFIGLMFFKVPSGLCIYFITSSLWGIAERKLIPKPKLPDSVVALKEADGKPSKGRTEREPAQPKPDAGAKRREMDKQRRKKRNNR